jgi:ABC transporter substrate binding protein
MALCRRPAHCSWVVGSQHLAQNPCAPIRRTRARLAVLHGRSIPAYKSSNGHRATRDQHRTGRLRFCGRSGWQWFVDSLKRPGGNITGFANFDNSIGGKWVEILREIAPGVKRARFIFSPEAAPNVSFFHAAESAAPSFGIELAALAVHTGGEIEQRVTKFAVQPDGGLIIAPHAVTLSSRELIASLSARYRLPAVYSDRYFAESGGLISFGNNTADLFRRVHRPNSQGCQPCRLAGIASDKIRNGDQVESCKGDRNICAAALIAERR